MPITISFDLKNETKTCYRFESREENNFITLYLKKSQIEAAGLDPSRGITATITQKEGGNP